MELGNVHWNLVKPSAATLQVQQRRDDKFSLTVCKNYI